MGGDGIGRSRARRRGVLVTLCVVGVAGMVAPVRAESLERLVVTVRPGASVPGVSSAHGLAPIHVYRHALSGFSVLADPGARRALARDPRVASVEADRSFAVAAQTPPTGLTRIFATANPTIDVDGLDDVRVDVDVAVLDTGISSHADLAVAGRTDCTAGACADGQGDDLHGHGTHVAGTIAALDNGIGVVGVAPGARLWSVKVLGDDGRGSTSTLIAGIDWATARAGTIEVGNMSLGCACTSTALNTAIANSVSAGVVYAVAAGNQTIDASGYTPANHPDVITVSALADFDGLPGGLGAPTCRTDQDDTLASFSNFGASIEIAAPGVCIRSTYRGGGYATLSGTSMASPHVAGAAAILASGANDPADGADVRAIGDRIEAAGNLAWTDDSGDGIKERLLDIGDATTFAAASTAGAGNLAPTASFTAACSSLKCKFDASASADLDGAVAGYSWAFGDGGTSTAMVVSHSYPAAGTYTATLTVTDDDAATGAATRAVTVTSRRRLR